MSKLVSGSLLYKCRNCGEIYEDCHVPNITTALVCLITCGKTPEQWGRSVTTMSIHNCKNGECGVSDIVGAKSDENS